MAAANETMVRRERRRGGSPWIAGLPGIAALLIALLTWYGGLKAGSQQLTDLSNQVGTLSTEIANQQAETEQQYQHLQSEIDQYLLRHGGN